MPQGATLKDVNVHSRGNYALSYNKRSVKFTIRKLGRKLYRIILENIRSVWGIFDNNTQNNFQ